MARFPSHQPCAEHPLPTGPPEPGQPYGKHLERTVSTGDLLAGGRSRTPLACGFESCRVTSGTSAGDTSIGDSCLVGTSESVTHATKAHPILTWELTCGDRCATGPTSRTCQGSSQDPTRTGIRRGFDKVSVFDPGGSAHSPPAGLCTAVARPDPRMREYYWTLRVPRRKDP